LESASNESIFVAIVNEHPQTMAVILSCMQPKQAAYIIGALAPERQLAVTMRIATMRQVDHAVLVIIAKEFEQCVSNQNYVNVGGVDTVAETLCHVEQGTVSSIMENLEQDDPELVAAIKMQMRTAKNIRELNKLNKGE